MAFKKLIITVLGLAAVLMPQVHAQFKRTMSYNYWRIGIGAGSSNYLGDLDDDFSPKFTRPGAAITAAYRVTPLLSMRGSLYYGQITASDAKSLDPIRNRRNLNFTSNLVEASVVGVVDFRMSQRRAKFRPNFTPYVFAGVALYSQITRTITVGGVTRPINIITAEASPLGDFMTQRDLDSLDRKSKPVKNGVPISIPMGVGMRFKVTPNIDIEVETGFRRTFTDYLDGVSQEYNLQNAAYGDGAKYIDPPTSSAGPLTDDELARFSEIELREALLNRYGVVTPTYKRNDDGTAWVLSGKGDPVINFNEYKGRGSRGDSKQLDWYTFTAVTVSFYLDSPRRCPSFR